MATRSDISKIATVSLAREYAEQVDKYLYAEEILWSYDIEPTERRVNWLEDELDNIIAQIKKK